MSKKKDYRKKDQQSVKIDGPDYDPAGDGTLTKLSSLTGAITNQYYRFTYQDMVFLKEYAKDLDPDRAGAAAKFSKSTVGAKMRNPAIQERLHRIHMLWADEMEMDAKQSAGNHIRLMKKFEEDYDVEKDPRFASSLAKMSEASLRATGHMDRFHQDKTPNVVINIGFDRNEDKLKDVPIININAETQED